jgi:hypothetical protein
MFVHVIQGPLQLLTLSHSRSDLVPTHIDLSNPRRCDTVSNGVRPRIRMWICDAACTANDYAYDTGQSYRAFRGFARTSKGHAQISRQPQGMMIVHSLTLNFKLPTRRSLG